MQTLVTDLEETLGKRKGVGNARRLEKLYLGEEGGSSIVIT